MDGYISVSEMADKTGRSGSYIRSVIMGKIIRVAGRKKFIRGKMIEGEDYKIENGKIWIKEGIEIVRGKVVRFRK